ncbi:MAG: ArnT family glycosyltransferase [Candidatus Binatia bacterium]
MVDPTEVAPEAAPVETAATETPTATVAPARRWTAPTIALYAVLVMVAWAGLELWGLGKAPFHTKGEPREGLVVWQMTHHGSWILPPRDGPAGLEVPSKPPFFHWLGALTSLIHGSTDEWSIRFPSAALSLIALLSIFATGTALWSPGAGLIGALALMTMFEWARAATGARVDMTLTFGLQSAFLSLLFFMRSRRTGWLIPLYIGIAVAVLGKGPVGIALPGLVALAMLALTRDATFLRQMRLGYGALTVGLAAGSWYVMALIRGGWQFFHKQILAENVFTFLNNQDFEGGHRHSVAYMFGALILGVLPWTIFLPGVASRLWRQRRQLSRSDARLYLLVWIVVVFGFYAVAASKRSVYLLSLYPAVALLLGWWWDEQRQAPSEEERWLARLLPFVGWTFTGLLIVIFAVVLLESLGAPIMAFIQPWLPADAKPFTPWISETIRSGRWALLGLLLAATASLYACVRTARAPRWTGIFASLFCSAVALTMSISQVILPGIAQHVGFRSFMADVRQVLGPEAELFFFKTFEYGAVFYWRDHIPSYAGPWPAGAPRYLLMEREEWNRMQPSAGDQYERVTFAGRDEAADGPLVLIRRIGQ